MPLHRLLDRQLKRIGIDDTSAPALEQWKNFLSKVDVFYQQTDQERYLLERSMDISSQEMAMLNNKLENAQDIARLGYWHRNIETGKIIWSRCVYEMLGLDASKYTPNFNEIISRAHDADRLTWLAKIKISCEQKSKYEAEVRIKHANGEYRWFYIIGHPVIPDKSSQPVKELTGIMLDITARKLAEEKLDTLNNQLLSSAKLAGMAEVATSILHNVGNVLNSVNISIELLKENLQKNKLEKLIAAIDMIDKNKENLFEYLNYDEKGKLVIQYLKAASNHLVKNKSMMTDEIINLHKSIDHIKDVIAMQQGFAGSSNLFQDVSLSGIIQEALRISTDLHAKYKIDVISNIEDFFEIKTDKIKLIQILINIIKNAKDSFVMAKNIENKKITIAINKIRTNNLVEIIISDNGIGISADNLKRIFTFGFTTKSDGHGFGLHSSAIAAKELGGSIRVHSDGVNTGSSFILTLPCRQNERVL